MNQIIQLVERRLPPDCYVFKHSTACPISARAADEVRGSSPSVPLYWINVIEERPLSNWVEHEYGIRHESPQLLRIQDGKVAEHWSHGKIKRGLIR